MSYADVNGVSLYYEEHGSGQPLILLHGGLGSGDMYAAILPHAGQGPPGDHGRHAGPWAHGRRGPPAAVRDDGR